LAKNGIFAKSYTRKSQLILSTNEKSSRIFLAFELTTALAGVIIIFNAPYDPKCMVIDEKQSRRRQ
jgi:hypothetical protein